MYTMMSPNFGPPPIVQQKSHQQSNDQSHFSTALLEEPNRETIWARCFTILQLHDDFVHPPSPHQEKLRHDWDMLLKFFDVVDSIRKLAFRSNLLRKQIAFPAGSNIQEPRSSFKEGIVLAFDFLFKSSRFIFHHSFEELGISSNLVRNSR